MSLYVKYRPQSFDEMSGNADVISYLQEALSDLEKCPKVFLFYGETGTGKTTIARIVSKELKCDSLDVTEIDSANFRGIDTVRELRRSSRFHSIVPDGARVWIIDEVHKATTDAQNALLKLLEEPPKNCYYILCTTDPNKLLPTIRSRCIQLQMLSLSTSEMFSTLRRIVKFEDKRLKKIVYDQIIEDSLGLPRTAIQILDRVLTVPLDQQLDAAKRSSEEQSKSIELCRALIVGAPWKAVRNILKGLESKDAEGIRRHILKYAEATLLNKESDRSALILESFWEPLYNVGFSGLVYCCYSVVKN